MSYPIELLNQHQSVWSQWAPLLAKKHCPQVSLFVGQHHVQPVLCVNRIIAGLYCSESSPCGGCQACRAVIEGIHPDLSRLGEEADIKIDELRELQHRIYQSPKRSAYRIVVLYGVERMGRSAGNALLKILEEPPAHTLFFLLATQISSILPTILSRCQTYIVHDQALDGQFGMKNYEVFAQYYEPESPRGALLRQSAMLSDALIGFLDKKKSISMIAEQYSSYELSDLLWILYWITAQAIYCRFTPNSQHNEAWLLSCRQLAQRIPPMTLLNQLSQINAHIKKINHNIHMNQTLALETIFIGFTG